MNGPERLKATLLDFWKRFGDRRKNGAGFPPEDKLAALIALSRIEIPYHKQQPIEVRREKFNNAKHKLHPWRRFGKCFVCEKPATARHHIVQLQSGGINSKKNIVSLCDECHAEIHPWLSHEPVNQSSDPAFGLTL